MNPSNQDVTIQLTSEALQQHFQSSYQLRDQLFKSIYDTTSSLLLQQQRHELLAFFSREGDRFGQGDEFHNAYVCLASLNVLYNVQG